MSSGGRRGGGHQAYSQYNHKRNFQNDQQQQQYNNHQGQVGAGQSSNGPQVNRFSSHEMKQQQQQQPPQHIQQQPQQQQPPQTAYTSQTPIVSVLNPQTSYYQGLQPGNGPAPYPQQQHQQSFQMQHQQPPRGHASYNTGAHRMPGPNHRMQHMPNAGSPRVPHVPSTSVPAAGYSPQELPYANPQSVHSVPPPTGQPQTALSQPQAGPAPPPQQPLQAAPFAYLPGAPQQGHNVQFLQIVPQINAQLPFARPPTMQTFQPNLNPQSTGPMMNLHFQQIPGQNTFFYQNQIPPAGTFPQNMISLHQQQQAHLQHLIQGQVNQTQAATGITPRPQPTPTPPGQALNSMLGPMMPQASIPTTPANPYFSPQTMGPPIQPQHQAMPQPQSVVKRRSNAIQIIDPNTMQPLDMETVSATPTNTEASSSETSSSNIDQVELKLEQLNLTSTEDVQPNVSDVTTRPLPPATQEIHSVNSVVSDAVTDSATSSDVTREERTPSADFEPISPTPLPDTPSKSGPEDFSEVKAKNGKKKANAAKRAELNQKAPGGSDLDAFISNSTSAESAATTPESIPPVLQEVPTPEVAEADPEVGNHVESTNHVPRSDATSPVLQDEDAKRSESAPASKSSSQIQLKYQYSPNQWSPINQDGKKQYSREFLLQLQDDSLSRERPPHLPLMDIVKEKAIPRGGVVGSNNLFMPSFVKPVNPRLSLTKKPSRDGRDSMSKRPPMSGPVKILDVKIEKVELHQTENAWKPEKLKDQSTNGDAQQSNDEVEVLLRKARGILNKLCPQKFDVLVEKFNKDLQIDTEEKLRRCIELVYEKAIDEPGFSVAYARMCEVMKQKQVMTTGPTGEPQVVNFRKLLVSRCQVEFQRDYMHGIDKAKYEVDLKEAGDDEAKKKLIQSEWEEKEMRARRRSLGNIRFIGELYKLKMLTARIMHECINQLITSTDEEPLECLCRLLTTVGKDLEQETVSRQSNTSPEEFKKSGMKSFDEYFNKIGTIISAKFVSSRVRFMLQDLVDLRRSNWVPRRDVAGPKTIEQIHKEAEREKTQNQLLNEIGGGGMRGNSGMGSRDSMQGRGPPGVGPNDPRKKNSRGSNQDEDWKMSTPRVSQFEKIDTSKIASFAQNSQRRLIDTEKMQLGPGSNRWASGSGSMILTRSKEDSVLDTRNKFSVLTAQDSGPHSLSGGYSSMSSGPSSMDFESRRMAGGPSRSMGGGMPGRHSRGPSVEADKQRVVDSIRQAATKTNGPSGHEGGSLIGGPALSVGAPVGNRPVPDRVSEASYAMEQARLLRGEPEISSDDVQKKMKILLEEYVSNDDDKEAVETTCTYFNPTVMSAVVEQMVTYVLDQKDVAKRGAGKLFNLLISRHLLLKKQFDEGLKAVFSQVEELICDYPKFWLYIGELIAPSLLANTLPMSFLAESGLPKTLSGNYLVGVIQAVQARSSQAKAALLWQTSGLTWDKFVEPDEVQSFITKNKLEFTLKTDTLSKSPKWIEEELSKLLNLHPKQTDEIVAWIEKNVKEKKTDGVFIQALTTAVAENLIIESNGSFSVKPDCVKERMNLLRKYIDNDLEREKQALYALQFLMHRMEHPNRLLHLLFKELFENDVITKIGFKSWERCDNPTKQEGKGVAVKSTTAFMTYLDEEDDDESDSEGDEDATVAPTSMQ